MALGFIIFFPAGDVFCTVGNADVPVRTPQAISTYCYSCNMCTVAPDEINRLCSGVDRIEPAVLPSVFISPFRLRIVECLVAIPYPAVEDANQAALASVSRSPGKRGIDPVNVPFEGRPRWP